jgi:ATP dependent DNA ligase domain
MAAEIKFDGFRIIARKAGKRVKLYSRLGNDLTSARATQLWDYENLREFELGPLEARGREFHCGTTRLNALKEPFRGSNHPGHRSSPFACVCNLSSSG